MPYMEDYTTTVDSKNRLKLPDGLTVPGRVFTVHQLASTGALVLTPVSIYLLSEEAEKDLANGHVPVKGMTKVEALPREPNAVPHNDQEK